MYSNDPKRMTASSLIPPSPSIMYTSEHGEKNALNNRNRYPNHNAQTPCNDLFRDQLPAQKSNCKRKENDTKMSRRPPLLPHISGCRITQNYRQNPIVLLMPQDAPSSQARLPWTTCNNSKITSILFLHRCDHFLRTASYNVTRAPIPVPTRTPWYPP